MRWIIRGVFVVLLASVSGYAQNIEELKAGVVRIKSSNQTGTGFVIKLEPQATYIVSASHVVAADKHPKVEFFKTQERVDAEVIAVEGEGVDDRRGLALLVVRAKAPPGVLSLALTTEAPKTGDRFQAIGFPAGGVPWGVVETSFHGRQGRELRFEGSFNSGISGGPILKDGRVIAVVMDEQQRFGSAVSGAAVEEFVRGWNVTLELEKPAAPTPPREVREMPVSPQPASMNLNGQYFGRIWGTGANGESYVCDYVSIMTQQGTKVTGEFSNSCGDRGTFAGEVTGSVLTTRLVSSVFGYGCETKGDIAQMGASLTGQFACTNGLRGTSSMSRR